MLRPRLRLTAVLTAMVFIGLVLALVVQMRMAERRERTLKGRLAASLPYQFALEGMSRLLGDVAIDILKQPSGVESLRISRGTEAPRAGNFVESVGVPTGVLLDDGIALTTACALLDHRNYGAIDPDDLSEPQVGLRFKRGSAVLDVLISLEGSRPGAPRQDVWIKVYDPSGKVMHAAGPKCMSDPDLQRAAESLLER